MIEAKMANASIQRERRKDVHAAVSLDGHVILSEEDGALCEVVDPSVGGAQMVCANRPTISGYVTLYINGLDRLRAITKRDGVGSIGVKFDMNNAERQNLRDKIKAFLNSGVVGVTHLRRYKRIPVPAEGTFSCPDDRQITCSARNFSLGGVFLETDSRPKPSELIWLGDRKPRVVRRDAKGFAIEFMTMRDLNYSQQTSS